MADAAMQDDRVPSRLTARMHPLAIIPCVLVVMIGPFVGIVLVVSGGECKIDLAHSNVDDYFEVKWYGVVLYRSKSAESTARFNAIAQRVAFGIGAVLGMSIAVTMILYFGRPVRRAWGSAAQSMRKIT